MLTMIKRSISLIRRTHRWLLRDLRKQRAFLSFFILNLTIGLFGFVVLESFKNSIQNELQNQGKNLLSADLSISARRFITDEEKKIFQNLFNDLEKKTSDFKINSSRRLDFFTMVLTKNKNSRLVSLRAIDEQFPLYGELLLGRAIPAIPSTASIPSVPPVPDSPVRPISFSNPNEEKITRLTKKDILSQAKVWVSSEFLIQSEMKLGDNLQIGDKYFTIDKVLLEDSTESFRMGYLAPRIYIGIDQLEGSSLMRNKGVTLLESYFFTFDRLGEEKLQDIQKQLLTKLIDPAIQVKTVKDSSQESVRPLLYLADYLGLVSMVSLFLAALGTSFLFRIFFLDQLKSIAIMNALGLEKERAFLFYFIELFLMTVLSLVLCFGLSYLSFPLIKNELIQWFAFKIDLHLSVKTMSLAFIVALLMSFFIGLPYLLSLRRVSTGILFQEMKVFKIKWKKTDSIWLGFFFIFFTLLAVFQSSSFKVGFLFSGIFLGLFILLFLFGKLIFSSLPIDRIQNWKIRHSFLTIKRKSASSLTALVSISLGILLVVFLPELKRGIQEEVSISNKARSLPVFFMFDIQDEQLKPFLKTLSDLHAEVQHLGPMIKARLLKVNQEDFEREGLNAAEDSVNSERAFQTREEEEEARFRNRGINLSYRNKNIHLEGESIIEGIPLNDWFEKTKKDSSLFPGLSIELFYAKRMKLKLGDILLFDVQGLEIKGQIVNIRKVKWNTFNPNFFVIFQEGVLEEAPKMYLASIKEFSLESQALSSESLEKLQLELVKQFPNISIINVRTLIQKLIQLANKISLSLELMAWLSILTGLVILGTVAHSQIRTRFWDLNMMKILGASPKDLFLSLAYEFAWLSFTACFLGVFLGLLLAHFLAYIVFDIIFPLDWFFPFYLTIFILSSVLLLVFILSRKVIKSKPQMLISNF